MRIRIRAHGPLVKAVVRAGLTLAAMLIAVVPAGAADRYALVVIGASGGQPYAERYEQWRRSLTGALVGRMGYPIDQVVVLAEQPNEAERVGPATRTRVLSALADFSQRVTRSDTLLVVLIGHGTSGGEEAKFNLVGPDLAASEWAEAVRSIAGTLLFIDTTGGSFPFLKALAGVRRIVMTATDSPAQQFETVLPEFFIRALTDSATDADKNGRISLWEVFTYASTGVRQQFDAQGQLPTERALLDDTGDGVGVGAHVARAGTVARAMFFEHEAPAVIGGAAGDLDRAQQTLVAQIEALKGLKGKMLPDQYAAQLEKLLLDLARVSAALKNKS